jgi:hypothetical protein
MRRLDDTNVDHPVEIEIFGHPMGQKMGKHPSMNGAYLGYLSVAGAFAREPTGARFETSQDLEQML